MELSFTPWEAEIAPSDSDGLAPLGWAALSARLAATHQLRRELVAGSPAHPRCGTASFAPGLSCLSTDSAQMIPGVNLEPLANGKAGDAMSVGTSEGPLSNDCRTRGLQ